MPKYFYIKIYAFFSVILCRHKNGLQNEERSKIVVIFWLNVPLSKLYPKTQKNYYNLKHGLSHCELAHIGVC
jgi:hypothetical protein